MKIRAKPRAGRSAWDEVADEARKAAEADPKQQVVTPTAEALAKWEKITASIGADWVKATRKAARRC